MSIYRYQLASDNIRILYIYLDLLFNCVPNFAQTFPDVSWALKHASDASKLYKPPTVHPVTNPRTEEASFGQSSGDPWLRRRSFREESPESSGEQTSHVEEDSRE